MTKKDYIAIAQAFLRTKVSVWGSEDRYSQWDIDVRTIAQVLAHDNPAFSMARFLKACGYEGDRDR